MLCGLAAVLQASCSVGVAFDTFSFERDSLTAPQVDVGGGQVGDALAVPEMVVVSDEVADLLLEIAWYLVVLERLMPALDLVMRLRMMLGTPDMVHALLLTPVCQITGDLARAVVAQQPRLV